MYAITAIGGGFIPASSMLLYQTSNDSGLTSLETIWTPTREWPVPSTSGCRPKTLMAGGQGDSRWVLQSQSQTVEMELVGVLSNHDLQGSLVRLAGKLAAVRASGGPRRQAVACRQRPRRPGWVLKAVVQVLADRDEPMRTRDIHAVVEASHGEPVRRASVKAALAANVLGASPRFVRVARGRYVLGAARRASSSAARRRKLRLSDRIPDRQAVQRVAKRRGTCVGSM